MLFTNHYHTHREPLKKSVKIICGIYENHCHITLLDHGIGIVPTHFFLVKKLSIIHFLPNILLKLFVMSYGHFRGVRMSNVYMLASRTISQYCYVYLRMSIKRSR